MRQSWAVAESFGLGTPTQELAPVSFRSSQTWRLVTRDGSALIKHVAAEDWLDDFARAMEFERLALAAGISMARPIPPLTEPMNHDDGPARKRLGFAAAIDGIGWVRAYDWVDGEPLADGDDVAGWLGETLARLHQLAPTADAARAPDWYRLDQPETWHGWLDDGQRDGRTWAALLRLHMADVLEAAGWVARSFAAAGDYVMTHRDVEPWNVMMTGGGPVLIDWDVAGADSASLEAAHATLEFSRRGRPTPDPAAVRRTFEAYVGAGGTPFGGSDVLARRAGLRLGRLAERLRMSLGDQDLGPRELAAVERRAAEQIAEMPSFLAALRNYRL
uniref:aminoglycoside phosphotransferase family protein n=1 Tax=Paractinoplanes polyasparticus TaxID=2856853 RepID=UPI001C860C08|nr:aminoglycoside phosphotransferase family protein [Actinoplanes polyasparticus]